jgi:alanine racemase
MEATTWVKVSAAALEANLRAVANHVSVPVCAVVKANAYGHGLVDAAAVFVRAGAGMLGVSRLEEARALRAAGIGAPILVMTPVLDKNEALALDVDITVGSMDEIAELPAQARVHLKIDTGMGRLGVRPAETFNAARAIAQRASLEGVWTHFADAAGPSGAEQLQRFDGLVSSLRSERIDVAVHAANSAAVLALPAARFDMVRVGTLAYGLDPPGATAPWRLAHAFDWLARVVAVRTLPAGATVGYGSEWTARDETRVATLPIGYADGFMLEPAARSPTLKERAKAVGRSALARADRAVYFDDRPAPVLGRVAMNAVTVDVGRLPDVIPGSIARIPARRLMVSPSIPRVWV